MTIKLTLTYDQQNALLVALQQLDMHEIIGHDKVVRVPYKLGSERRALVKNIRALQSSLAVWQEVTKAIFKENFPDVPDGVGVLQKDHPVEYSKYIAAITASSKESEEVEMTQFSSNVLYEENEFPSMVLALLEERGLVEEDIKSPKHLREVK